MALSPNGCLKSLEYKIPMSECVVLFSGGSDSFCSAALAAEKHEKVHLVTFYEAATRNSPWPVQNFNLLKKKYGEDIFTLSIFSTDKIVKSLSYKNFFSSLFKYHFYNLATPGLSSLSWHTRTILYCLEKNINVVYDGMTKELLHLPGHMPEVRVLFKNLYQQYDIDFSSMVIDWDIPEDQRFMDRLIVDRHGFTLGPKSKSRTTGEWLFNNNLLPNKNVKGSDFDRLMQHDCYPFIIYNMLVFWLFEPLIGYEKFKIKLSNFMGFKISEARLLITNSLRNHPSFSFVKSIDENLN